MHTPPTAITQRRRCRRPVGRRRPPLACAPLSLATCAAGQPAPRPARPCCAAGRLNLRTRMCTPLTDFQTPPPSRFMPCCTHTRTGNLSSGVRPAAPAPALVTTLCNRCMSWLGEPGGAAGCWRGRFWVLWRSGCCCATAGSAASTAARRRTRRPPLFLRTPPPASSFKHRKRPSRGSKRQCPPGNRERGVQIGSGRVQGA